MDENISLIDYEEVKRGHGVVNGKLAKNYYMKCNIPDVQTFLQSVILGVIEQPIKTEYTNVLMCALPKSGSMHTWQLISRSIGYDRLEAGFGFQGNRFYFPRLLAAKYTEMNTISHCHEEFSPNIRGIISGLDLKVIIHTRNLLDELVSRRDLMFKFMPEYPSPEAREKFFNSDNEYQLDYIIERFSRDYINFVTGWDYYKGDVMRTTYEEMLADEVGLIYRIADWLRCEVIGDVEKISKQIKGAGGINFNKGVSGRGSEMFNARQKEEIWRRADMLGCRNEEFLGK